MTLDNLEKTSVERFAAISLLRTKVQMGMSLAAAISEVTKAPFYRLDGQELRLSRRTLYRWWSAYQAKNILGITPKCRPRATLSKVLPVAFIDFLVTEKKIDPDASLPEIIRRAEVDGIVAAGGVSRVSVWRQARRLNLPIFAEKSATHDDQRRFEHPFRMRMMLCDGKHFKAGATGRKRVVFCYLDDATRRVLGAVVGAYEDRTLFLRGLMKIIRRFGMMDAIYVDRGAGFKANDSILVCSRLGIGHVLGRARYPEGHGKIERFNQTCMNDLLRGLSADPAIDPDFIHLEARIEHYLLTMYNPRPHEGLKGLSPNARWEIDERELSPPQDMRKVEDHFIVTEQRHVAKDNVVMLDGHAYEMPLGYRGRRVQVFRHFLEDRFTVLHEEKHVSLSRVDLHANAKDKRIKQAAHAEPVPAGKIRTAAMRAYDRDFATVLSPDGDFYDKE